MDIIQSVIPWIIQLASVIGALSLFIKPIIRKIQEPNKQEIEKTNKRVDEVDKRVDVVDKRLDSGNENFKLLFKTLLSLVNHGIDGNGYKDMREVRDEITNYLAGD